MKPNNPKSKAEQREIQPENADRLAILVDPAAGVFTQGNESKLQNLSFRSSTRKAYISDVLKVHDFHYVSKMIETVKKLEGSRNKVLTPFDGQDTVVSEKSWDAALLAAGAVVEACDAVMTEGYRNAFCATRPPGHHAGIFGKTFHADDP